MLQTMIVDDVEVALKLLEHQLQKFPGVSVVYATTKASDVLTKVDEYIPDVIFLDINLGELSGMTLAKEIQAKYPSVQIVFLTAYAQFAVDAFELEAVDYLVKPVTVTRLKKTMDRLLRQHTSEQRDETVKRKGDLYVQAFRTPDVQTSHGQMLHFRTNKAREMLFFLWQSPAHAASRDTIIETLWPEWPYEKATQIMHSTIYQLRQTLRKVGLPNALAYERQQYRLTPVIDSDVAQWQTIIERSSISREDVDHAFSLYTGPYFAEADYSWAMSEQRRLQQRWEQFLLHVLKTYSADKTLHEHIFNTLSVDTLYTEEWLTVQFQYFGQTQQLARLVETYERAQDYWGEQFGLDIPKPVQQIYIDYVTTA